MKTQAACVHASREEPCWGPLQVAVAEVVTCAGHYYVEATGGRYVAQGERHAFASKIEAMRSPATLDFLGSELREAMKDPKWDDDPVTGECGCCGQKDECDPDCDTMVPPVTGE